MKLIKTKNAFSLIEVLIATMILTVGVFGIYKLIGENTKNLNNSTNLYNISLILNGTVECIKNLGFDNFSSNLGETFSFNYGASSNECNTGSFNSNLNFNPILINNIEFYSYGTITSINSNTIDWDLEVLSEGIGKKSLQYIQAK